MKTYIIKNTEAKTGYSIVTKEDDGRIVDTMLIDEYDPNNPKSLKLPENPSNRKYFSIEKIGDGIELTYKESKTFGPRGSGKKIEDYLTAEEKKIIEEIYSKAKKRKEEEDKRELSPIEKAQKELEKWKKKVAELKKAEKEAKE